MPAQEVPRAPCGPPDSKSLAAGAPRAPQPCWMRTSRTRQAPAAWRARSYSRPRALLPARVRGPCLPLHSSPRGRAGRPAATSLVHLKPGHFRDFIVCSCRSSYLAVRVGRSRPPSAVPTWLSCRRMRRLGQRTGVQDSGEAQRPPEGAPTLRKREASRIRMQVRSPARPSAAGSGTSLMISAGPIATNRSNSEAGARFRQPTQVRTGGARRTTEEVYPAALGSCRARSA